MNQKKQVGALVVLLLIAGFIWLLYFDHDKPVVTADARSPKSRRPAKPNTRAEDATSSVENFRLHRRPSIQIPHRRLSRRSRM